jgi:hypothetical protein
MASPLGMYARRLKGTRMKYGTVNNLIMGDTKSDAPSVGMGATELKWSDRVAYTIVEIKNAKLIIVQADRVVSRDRNGYHKTVPDPEGQMIELRLHKDGRWYSAGGRVFLLGVKDAYYDPEF